MVRRKLTLVTLGLKGLRQKSFISPLACLRQEALFNDPDSTEFR